MFESSIYQSNGISAIYLNIFPTLKNNQEKNYYFNSWSCLSLIQNNFSFQNFAALEQLSQENKNIFNIIDIATKKVSLSEL